VSEEIALTMGSGAYGAYPPWADLFLTVYRRTGNLPAAAKAAGTTASAVRWAWKGRPETSTRPALAPHPDFAVDMAEAESDLRDLLKAKAYHLALQQDSEKVLLALLKALIPEEFDRNPRMRLDLPRPGQGDEMQIQVVQMRANLRRFLTPPPALPEPEQVDPDMITVEAVEVER
jgi:hypothetical protein